MAAAAAAAAQQLPAPPMITSSKISGGIAKKAIDKQSRKERNRYAALRQTPAGSQANTTNQQQYQQTVATTTLDKTIDVDSETDSNHDTALTLACAGGHEELVQLLLNRNANIEHRDKKGFTPLILAATAGHEKVVEILLKHGAELEAQSERTKDTPLSLACSGGRYEVVELLLKHNANKEHRNVSDYTPLSLAASGGYVNIIKLLLNHGAEINSRTGSKLGISPLMLAAMNGHTAAVKLLLDQGSDINAQIETNRNTALTLACFQGRHEVVSLLLDRKANVEHRAKTGLTPLMEAASGGYIDVGRVLLDKGADVNAAPVPTSRDTALTIAADKGHLKFVELLLSRGAAVEVKNKKGNSPLWLAAHGGHLSVVEILYNHHADIDSQDNRRVSCLMAAYRKGHTKVVKWMVQYVAQYPSDQEMSRFISTVSDKELSEKCFDCMKYIRQAKEAQAVRANQNASILLKELDNERTREESRKAAAARRRERKKKKKLEKKEEKRRQMEGATGGSVLSGSNDADDKDSDQDDDSDRDDNALEDEEYNQNAQEGDSGIDQGSCSSAEIKSVAVGNNAQAGSNNAQQRESDKNGKAAKNSKKKKNTTQQVQQQQRNTSSDRNSSQQANSPAAVTNAAEDIPAPSQKSANKQPASARRQQDKEQDQVLAKGNSTSAKKNAVQAVETNTNSATKTVGGSTVANKKVESQQPSARKEDTNKKRDSNKQREKENLAPKETSQPSISRQSQRERERDQNQQHHANVGTEKAKGEKLHDSNNYPTHVSASSGTGGVTSVGGNSNSTTRKSLIFSATRNTAAGASTGEEGKGCRPEDHSASTSGSTLHKSTLPKRGEDGWKEVVRKSSTQQGSTTSSTTSASTSASTASTSASGTGSTSSTTGGAGGTMVTGPPAVSEMICKKVQVPVNAISRVIGRAGSNINAIRATTGAHIEVEKQGKNQSERSITIKGQTDATKQAHILILSLIKDPEVDILQMLPRINASIKASSLPLSVGTWDNKTATATSQSSSGSSASSTSSSTSASVAHTTNTANNNGSQTIIGGNGTVVASSAVGSSKATGPGGSKAGKSQPIGGGGKSNSARTQGPKTTFHSSQQPGNRGGQSQSSIGGSQKLKPQDTPTGSGSSKTTGAAHGSGSSSVAHGQKNNITSKQQHANGERSSNTVVNTQTFAAKLGGSALTNSLVGHNSPSKKVSDGLGTGRIGASAPYGRGKPVPSSASTAPQLGGGVSNSNQNSNTNNALSGPIGVFNPAEVAAVNAAAAAAAAAAAVSAANTAVSSLHPGGVTTSAVTTSAATITSGTTTATTTSTTAATFAAAPGARAVTPIGPPNKRNQGDSPVTAAQPQHSQTTPMQQQKQQQVAQQQQQQHTTTISGAQQAPIGTAAAIQQQQHQQLVINCSETTLAVGGSSADNANSTGLNNTAAGGFGAQLASKISNEYTLFFNYQSQWGENVQMFNSPSALVSDSLPKADASKAPGYNRNILNSPVGGSSKASSSHSTSPPSSNMMPAPIGTQQAPIRSAAGNTSTSNSSIIATSMSSGGSSTAGSSSGINTATSVVTSGEKTTITTTNIADRNDMGIGLVSVTGAAKELQLSTQLNATSGSGDTHASPGVIKPPAPIGQPSAANTTIGSNSNASPNIPPSGLAIQRPPPNTSQQHRSGIVNTSLTPPSSNIGALDGSAASTQPPTMNFGPIGPNHSARNNNNGPPGAIGEPPLNRFFEPLGGTGNSGLPHHMKMPPHYGMQMHGGLGGGGGSGSHPLSRLNLRNSAFGGPGGAGNMGTMSQAPIGQPPQQQPLLSSGIFHQQHQQPQLPTNPNFSAGKSLAPGSSLAPGTRAQSQPQNGPKWYGGYVDALNLENGGLGGAGNNSPAAMSPNQAAVSSSLLQQHVAQQQQQQEDMRKMPRPIGTERASWKFSNYPMNSGGVGGGMPGPGMDDGMSSAMPGAVAGLMHGPWMMDKPQQAVPPQQAQQHSNWMKQQYRFYGGGAAAGGGGLGGGMGGPTAGPADYHHQEQFHIPLDYHSSMAQQHNMQQNTAMNLMPPYGYPYMGQSGADMQQHMMSSESKLEMWEHDKQMWQNWSN
uniref:Ankyrin repeat and KH domain-containing protein mask n=3 Tax=Ceratitis capitata TaxID=7213 RepID=W8AVD4_CERCA